MESTKTIRKRPCEEAYSIFKRISKNAVISFVVLQAKWFDVKIDAEQNEKLIERYNNKFNNTS